VELPHDVWQGLEFNRVHAAVMFADIENSVMISSTVSLSEYDRLINEFQEVMLKLVDGLRDQGFPVKEAYVAGDQLAVFLYYPEEVELNYSLDGPEPSAGEERLAQIERCSFLSKQLVYAAVKAAVQLKNLWLVQDFNIQRVRDHHPPFELMVGVHHGRVHLRNRPDGRRRIEGYAVNLAKRVESTARLGGFSRVMFSQDACETLRRSVIAHTQLRQRVFFEKHMFDLYEMKGLMKPQPVFELKFLHQITTGDDDKAIPQHESIFAVDPTNIWSYYQLVDYYAYTVRDWEKAYMLASRAYVANPRDEKVKLDLGKYHFHKGELEMSKVYCLQALEINPDFDLAYEQLALIANTRNDMAECVEYLRQSVSLSPGSAVNYYNLGLALVETGAYEEAAGCLSKAVERYPQYLQQQILAEYVGRAAEHVEIPELLQPALSGSPAGS